MAKHETTYVSEFTRFMSTYLEEHPEVVVDQHLGRAIYWDKQVEFEALKTAEESAVPIDSYYYFGNPCPHEVAAVGTPPAKSKD